MSLSQEVKRIWSQTLARQDTRFGRDVGQSRSLGDKGTGSWRGTSQNPQPPQIHPERKERALKRRLRHTAEQTIVHGLNIGR